MKKWLILGVEQGWYKMALEHFSVPDKRKFSRNHEECLQDTNTSQFEGAPSGKIGKFEHQIDNDSNR